MATLYCNEQDLYKILSDLDSYDEKNDLLESDFVLSAGIIYENADSGNVQVLYIDGADQGVAAANAGAVSTHGDWFYNSSIDLLTVALTNSPTDYRLEFASQTWEDTKTLAMQQASEEFDSYVDVKFSRPLPKATSSNSSREYDYVIIRCTAILAVIQLILSSDPRSHLLSTYRDLLFNEEGTGYIDRISNGSLKFSFEITESSRSGEIEEVTTDASTTGYPSDPIGVTSVVYGVSLLEIVVGGEVVVGTENTTVTYKITDQAGVEILSETLLTSLYQDFGYSITGRWTSGVYVSGDQWKMVVNGTPSTTQFKSISFTR